MGTHLCTSLCTSTGGSDSDRGLANKINRLEEIGSGGRDRTSFDKGQQELQEDKVSHWYCTNKIPVSNKNIEKFSNKRITSLEEMVQKGCGSYTQFYRTDTASSAGSCSKRRIDKGLNEMSTIHLRLR